MRSHSVTYYEVEMTKALQDAIATLFGHDDGDWGWVSKIFHTRVGEGLELSLDEAAWMRENAQGKLDEVQQYAADGYDEGYDLEEVERATKLIHETLRDIPEPTDDDD